MMEPLPVGGFRWMRTDELTSVFIMSLSEDGDCGCFVQCTLLYPPALHHSHDDYPLALVKRKIIYSDLSPVAREMCNGHNLKRTLNKERLLATFEIRKDYMLHYRNFQLYMKLGLQVLDLKAGLLFRQKRVIIDPKLVGVEMRYSSVKLNKPYYIGVAILELAKLHMYDFHYNEMKPLFGKDLCLLYTDTDSLLYEIENCADLYVKIFQADKQSKFDLSNFPLSHHLHNISQKRLPGAFKDECNAVHISQSVGLHSKMYSLLFDDVSEVTRAESKVAKGVKGCVI